jgi:hypothetical protein
VHYFYRFIFEMVVSGEYFDMQLDRLPIECFGLVLTWLEFVEVLRAGRSSRGLRWSLGEIVASSTRVSYTPARAGMPRLWTRAPLAGAKVLAAVFGAPIIADGGLILLHAARHGRTDKLEWMRERQIIVPYYADRVTLLRAFGRACERGFLGLALWLNAHFAIESDEIRSAYGSHMLLARVCAQGRLGVAQWLVAVYRLTDADVYVAHSHSCDDALSAACRNGHIDTAQWLAMRFDLQKAGLIQKRALRSACVNGHLAIARWLVAQFGKSVCDLGASSKGSLLNSVCRGGYFDVMRWWVVEWPTLSTAAIRAAVACACENGHLTLAAWLIARSKLTVDDIRINDCKIFKTTCVSGRKRAAEWLVATFRLTRDDIIQAGALRYACGNGHLAFAQWLISRFRFGVADSIVALRSACETGYCVMAQWLASHLGLDKREVRALTEDLWPRMDHDGHDDVLSWIKCA